MREGYTFIFRNIQFLQLGRSSFYSLLIMLLTLPCLAANTSISEEDITSLGEDFLKKSTMRAEHWMKGNDTMPSLINRADQQANSWIINSDSRNIKAASDIATKQALATSDISTKEAIMGQAWSLKQDFRKKVNQEISSGLFYQHYNDFIAKVRQQGCWRQFEQKTDECKKSLAYGFGILISLIDNKDILADTSIPPEKVIKALNQFLHFEPLDAKSEIAFQTLRYSYDKSPVSLHQIGYRINEQANVFSDFGKGVLTQIKYNGETDNDLLENQLVNLFRTDVDLLQTLLNDRSKEWDLVRGAVSRLDSIKTLLNRFFGSYEKGTLKNGFSVNEFYSGLGLLDRYYEDQSEYPKLDKVRQFRGDLRSSYVEITDSFLERSFLKIWGYLSDYGTSMATMTITLIILFASTFLASLITTQKFCVSQIAEGVEDVLKIATLRGEKTKMQGHRFLLFLEFVFAMYIPTYLGFLITFMLRAK